IPSPFSGTAIDLSVPTFSQETHKGEFPEYDGGGEAWCSPTSTAMVLAFHGAGPSEDDLSNFPGDRYDDPQVDYAARATYEWNYKGAGNWPANVAYASRFGLEGFVTRLRSLNEAQRFVEASIPLVASITGKLPGLLFGETNGHLLVIRGFDRNGNVITNDPAAPTCPVSYHRFALSAGPGTTLTTGGALTLATSGLTPTTYTDPHLGTTRSYSMGSWTSGTFATGFGFTELVASWIADTPAGTF